jgi:hypothetical protein
MAGAAIVSAAAGVAAWRAVPWQGRQTAVIMAVAMLILATTDGDPVVSLVLGAVLVISAMVGTMGVRGTTAAATCCHRALVSLVMAICSFESVSTAGEVSGVDGHSHAQAISGLLPVLVTVGVIAVVLWTVVVESVLTPVHRGRTARFLTIESWAMAAGVAVMCPGF